MDVTTANGADSHPWLTAGRQALVSGTLASFFSTAALALFGKAEARSFVAPTNATSHWLWGNDAYSEYEPSLRHTGVGYVTHHVSAVFWALFYERWLNSSEHHSTAGILRDAALTAGVAAVVDYTLTPERLRPGFEQHLSRASLVGVFAAFAAGLAAGALLNRQHERRLERLLTLPE
jgi:hypothetical protein